MNDELRDVLAERKPWPDMSRAEKREAYEALAEAFEGIADDLRTGIDMLLAEGGCSLRSTVTIKIDVDPNDDPRLP